MIGSCFLAFWAEGNAAAGGRADRQGDARCLDDAAYQKSLTDSGFEPVPNSSPPTRAIAEEKDAGRLSSGDRPQGAVVAARRALRDLAQLGAVDLLSRASGGRRRTRRSAGAW